MSIKLYVPMNYKGLASIYSRTYRAGDGTISGTVKVGAVAIQCRVFLFEYPSMAAVDFMLTDADGNYSFKLLNKAYRYAVTAQHPTAQYNNVIAVNLTPV